jgi:hypothetical protein
MTTRVGVAMGFLAEEEAGVGVKKGVGGGGGDAGGGGLGGFVVVGNGGSSGGAEQAQEEEEGAEAEGVTGRHGVCGGGGVLCG